MLLVLLLTACGFSPDLTRFEECTADRTCPPNFICLTEANRCVPACGQTPCPLDEDGGVDAGATDSGTDAGTDAGPIDSGVDAGTDAGPTDAGPDDAGTNDAGDDSGVDAGDAGPMLALSNAPLPVATELSPYTFTFMPSGGVGGYHFTIDGGVPGFSLNTGGTFFTPTTAPQAGQFSFTLTVSDDDVPANRVTNTYGFTVRPLLRVANANELNEGRVSRMYDEPLQATGGQAPYSWRVPDGGLPAWATIASGRITGNPTAATANFTLEVTDSSLPTPQIATRRVQLTTAALDLTLTNATPLLPDGRVGAMYQHTLRAGATLTTNYNWSVFAGALPPGVTLTNTPPTGVLSGMPGDAGTFNVTLRVTDGVTPVNRVYSITVYPQ